MKIDFRTPERKDGGIQSRLYINNLGVSVEIGNTMEDHDGKPFSTMCHAFMDLKTFDELVSVYMATKNKGGFGVTDRAAGLTETKLRDALEMASRFIEDKTAYEDARKALARIPKTQGEKDLQTEFRKARAEGWNVGRTSLADDLRWIPGHWPEGFDETENPYGEAGLE